MKIIFEKRRKNSFLYVSCVALFVIFPNRQHLRTDCSLTRGGAVPPIQARNRGEWQQWVSTVGLRQVSSKCGARWTRIMSAHSHCYTR